jgi:phosphoribosylformylglycinamidine cyclo-ligase
MAGYGIDDAPGELGGATLADVLLEPHANYVMPIRRVLNAGVPVKAMAHITGGGVVENVPRVLPDGLGVVIDRATWSPQPIFQLMQDIGGIEHVEMHRTFNMGVGLVIVAPAGFVDEIAAAMLGFKVWELGTVVAGVAGTQLVGA